MTKFLLLALLALSLCSGGAYRRANSCLLTHYYFCMQCKVFMLPSFHVVPWYNPSSINIKFLSPSVKPKPYTAVDAKKRKFGSEIPADAAIKTAVITTCRSYVATLWQPSALYIYFARLLEDLLFTPARHTILHLQVKAQQVAVGEEVCEGNCRKLRRCAHLYTLSTKV